MLDPNLFNSGQFSSLGNIVTAGLRLYFMRFKPYLRMAIAAHLWLLIPFYGWARYCSLSALLAQRSFDDLVRSSESISSPQNQVGKRSWSILITNILIIFMVISVAFLAFVLIIFIFSIVVALLSGIFSVSMPKFNSAKPFNEPISLTFGLGANLFWIIAASWFYARYFIVEIPLILECDYKPLKAIKRCRNLTKGSTFLSLGVITLVFVLTCPLSYLIANLSFRLIILVPRALQLDFSTRVAIDYSLLAVLCLFLNAVTMPFWQATKAVLYYSLRSRREGFDLQIRDGDLPSERA